MTADPWKPITSHVVVLDDEPEDARQVSEVLHSCFEKSNLKIRVDVLNKADGFLACLATHPDIVFCDVSLDGRDDIKGLELIQNYKKRYPHVAFAAMTWNLEQLEKLGQIITAPDYIIPKKLLIPDLDEEFKKRILEIILQNTRQNRYFRLTMEKEVEASIKKVFSWPKFDRDTVECLTRQVFSTNVFPSSALDDLHTADKDLDLARHLIQQVHIRQFEIGRSGSAVFLARSKIDNEEQDVSVVLKFCTVDSFSRELRNFARYVKWTLPYAWRVDVLGVGRVRSFGVIGYSLAFAGSAEAKPLSYFVGRADCERVEVFISKAFDPNQKVWYRNPRVRDLDLRPTLTDKYFHSRAEQNQRVTSAVAQITGSKGFASWVPQEGHDNKRLTFIRMLETVLNHRWRPHRICICHGDLHAGNVMISKEGSGMAFIDFQDTDLHHVFTDFVFFENAIRKDGTFDWSKPEESVSLEQKEVASALSGAFADTDSDLSDGHRLVRRVRKQAFLNFPDEARQNFFVHALMFSILMMSSSSTSASAVERLSSFIIAAVDVLHRHLGGEFNGRS